MTQLFVIRLLQFHFCSKPLFTKRKETQSRCKFSKELSLWLLLLGLFIGMGAMSKYIIVLFCIILFFWLLWDKKHRPLLWHFSCYCSLKQVVQKF